MLSHLARTPDLPITWLEDVFVVHWPGDFGPKLLSAPTYSFQIGRATKAGEILGDSLAGWSQGGGLREVVLVAHSLGSRVALETIRQLRRHKQAPEVLGCVLMAGAVPEHEVVDQEYFARLEAAYGRPVEVVMYSGHDWVLRFTFPLGQTLRTDQWTSPVLPRAIGLKGGPVDRWRAGNRLDMAPYGHGDYWKNRYTAEVVSRMFGRSSVRYLSGRHVPAWVPEPAESLDERRLEEHLLFDY